MKKIRNWEEWCDAWKRSDICDIYEAYSKPSALKVRAWENCKRLAENIGGRKVKIIGHNSSVFTVACRYINKYGDPCLCVITRFNVYYFKQENGEEDTTKGAPDVGNDIKNLETLEALTASPSTRRTIRSLILDLSRAGSGLEVREAYHRYEDDIERGRYVRSFIEECEKVDNEWRGGLVTLREAEEEKKRLCFIYKTA